MMIKLSRRSLGLFGHLTQNKPLREFVVRRYSTDRLHEQIEQLKKHPHYARILKQSEQEYDGLLKSGVLLKRIPITKKMMEECKKSEKENRVHSIY